MGRSERTALFTAKDIAALEPKDKKYVEREPHGLGVLVYPSGLKQYVCITEYKGKRLQVILGDASKMSLKQARDDHYDKRKAIRAGFDPGAEKRAAALKLEEEKRALEAAKIAATEHKEYTFEVLLAMENIPKGFVPATVAQLAAVWVVRYSRVNHTKGVQRDALCSIKKHFIPSLGQHHIKEVRRKHALELIEGIAATHPGAARNVMKYGRQIFGYGVGREWGEIQPFVEIVKHVPKVAPKSDDRNLSDKEVVEAWKGITTSASSLKVKRALKLVLVTMQRPGEVAQMHFDQIDGRWWTIPAEVAKNDREHRVYLTDTALALIGAGEGRVFASLRSESGHIDTNTLSQAINRGYLTDEVVQVVGNRRIKARKEPYFGMQPWSPHDLRRTGRTNCPRFGVSDEHGEEVINHMKPGIVGVYNKYKYDNEKQVALTAWEKFLLEILGDAA